MITTKQHIKLVIDCYELHLMVDREEEALYRRAATLLNETYKKYAQNRPDVPITKLWVYTALEIAVDLQSDKRGKDLKPILEKIKELNQQIEDNLQTKKENY